jgi:RND family efflux transporter MFP subunit
MFGHRNGEVDVKHLIRTLWLARPRRRPAVWSLLLAAATVVVGLSILRLAAPSSAAVEDRPASDQRQAAGDAAATLAQAQTPVPSPPAIPVVKPRTQTVSDTLEVTGNAAAVNQVKLIARVVGFLEKIHFEDGQVVRKGDLLFTIQQDQYKAQLAQAQAQLHGQQAALVYAKTEVVRYTALLKRDAATQVDVDHWNFEQASAEANIAAAQAQVALAQLNLGYTEIRAPFDGQMGKHLVDVGNVVGGNGQEINLADIVQLDPIYVVANLSVQQALQIRTNLDARRLTLEELHKVPIDAALSDETGFPHHGTLEYVAPGIDQATGTLLVRGILQNPTHTLVPGIFVKVRLPMGKVLQSALMVPDRALQEDQGGRYLLVVGQDDVVRQQYVQLGELIGSLRVITSGLKADDRVVVGELWRATPGTKVTPQLTAIGG